MSKQEIGQLFINTVRFLAVGTVEKAKSGHPGTPMGAVPMAYALWDRHLRHNPSDPKRPNRDKFILSPGHVSALLYALLHVTGYDLPMEDLKSFWQRSSRTPGHPECGLTPGVELAIAERWLAEHHNRPGYEIIHHYTYTIVSDGGLQEGVASEAASLVCTLRLIKLIYLYDGNDISVEGNTDIAFAEHVAQGSNRLLKKGSPADLIGNTLKVPTISNGDEGLFHVNIHRYHAYIRFSLTGRSPRLGLRVFQQPARPTAGTSSVP